MKFKFSPIFPVIAAVLFFLIIKFFIIDIVRVSGHSMEPAIPNGKIIFINKLSYGLRVFDRYVVQWRKPQIGEIIVVRNPMTGYPLVKRCVGNEGDYIQIQNGILFIGGKKVKTELSEEDWYYNRKLIPLGHLFVLGDNAESSVDSRFFGFLTYDNILGKVIF